MTDLLFKVVYYVPGVGRMECAVRESQLVTMLSALIESGFHIQSASIWYKDGDKAA